MALLHNKWKKGKRNFVRPPIPDDLRGSTGARLDRIVFDQDVGSEVSVTILEHTDFGRQLVAIDPFTVFCTTGMGNTDHGPVIFLVFSVFSEKERAGAYEMFLNPFDGGAIDLLEGLSQQTHVKVLVHDMDIDEVLGFYEFPNNFGIGPFLDFVRDAVSTLQPGDFLLAREQFMSETSLEDLLNVSPNKDREPEKE